MPDCTPEARFRRFLLLMLLWSCSPAMDYGGQLRNLAIVPEYPDGEELSGESAVTVTVEDAISGASYTKNSTTDGGLAFKLPDGNYRVRFSRVVYGAEGDETIYNGSREKIIIAKEDVKVSVPLTKTIPGKLVFKEIYCGGCQKYPVEGNYQSDKYVIIHNNSSAVQYLDGYCFGTLDPYNSSSISVWHKTDPESGELLWLDFVPVIQAVLQFPGNGSDFPLESGEDAVLCLTGAIDHSLLYPDSVNLNKEDYFVCYNQSYFPNVTYHPAPGDKIRTDHYMDIVVKTGQANAYTLSVSSPAVVLFKAPEGIDLREYLGTEGAIVQKPGTASDRIAQIPVGWVEDAVEVYTNSISGSSKRINPPLDAGYVRLTETFQGRALKRRTDETASAKAGYEKLRDTNNSSSDWYVTERNSQSLK